MRITSPRSTASLLLTITAFAVAGCSDTAPSGTSGSAARDLTAVRACDLLTPTDIEMATGIAPGTGEDMTELDGRLPMCNWTPATGGFRPVANLLVTTSSYTDYDEFVRMANDNAFGIELGEFERVDGVGRFGVWLAELEMLQVFDDDLMVQVAVDVAEDRDPVEAAKALAEAVLGHLQ